MFILTVKSFMYISLVHCFIDPFRSYCPLHLGLLCTIHCSLDHKLVVSFLQLYRLSITQYLTNHSCIRFWTSSDSPVRVDCRRWSCVKLRTCQDCQWGVSWKFWREGNTWRPSCETKEGRKVKCMTLYHWSIDTFYSPLSVCEVWRGYTGATVWLVCIKKFVEQNFSMVLDGLQWNLANITSKDVGRHIFLPA